MAYCTDWTVKVEITYRSSLRRNACWIEKFTTKFRTYDISHDRQSSLPRG